MTPVPRDNDIAMESVCAIIIANPSNVIQIYLPITVLTSTTVALTHFILLYPLTIFQALRLMWSEMAILYLLYF